MTQPEVNTLFLDIGGVLLTNGWDRHSREKACDVFHLDYDEMNERHHLTFDTYEEGKLSLDEYLNRTIFYEPRTFSREAFKQFMFDQSQPFPDMLALMRTLKEHYHLKIAVVSNEGRELTVYRIQRFGLGSFVDFFICSAFVHFRKPDEDIFRIALDLAQCEPKQVAYIEDRALFVEVAKGMGIRGLKHNGYETTKAKLAEYGLRDGSA